MNLKVYSFFISFLLCCSFCSAQISINIIAPQPEDIMTRGPVVVGDAVSISVRITSTYQLSTVKASVAGRETSLTYTGIDRDGSSFSGSLSLVGTKHGDTVDILVTAVDYLGNQKTANRKVIYDVRPVLTLESPLNETVARPTVRLKFKCEDIDSCKIQVRFPVTGINHTDYYGAKTVFSGTVKDSLDTILDLSQFDGVSGRLEISATDKRNYMVTSSSFIYVDTNPYLNEIVASDTKIIDFNYGKVLSYGKEKLSYPVLIDVDTKQKTSIPIKLQARFINYNGSVSSFEYGKVTPYGAFIQGLDSFQSQQSFPYSSIYEFNKGAIELARFTTTAGKFAIGTTRDPVSNVYTLYLRDLETKQNTVVSTISEYSTYSLSANGLVVFTDYYERTLFTYKDGIKTKIADNFNASDNFPLTDGKNIVYKKFTPYCCGYLQLYNGQSTILVKDSLHNDFYPYRNYQLNHKFVAYTKIGSSGQKQVWLYDSLGKHSQISFFGDNTEIDLLTPRGDVVYNREKNRYIKLRSGDTYEISRFGKTYFYDSTFYVAIGRSLFKVLASCNVNAKFTRSGSTTTPATITFTNQTTPDSANTAYKWYFGNGDSSTAKNPVYTYRSPGTYYVRMVATRGSCTSTFTDTILICDLTTRFTYSGSTTAPAAITFTNQSTPDSTGTAYKWYFGSGDSSAVKNPVYTYQRPGTYTVRLTSTKGNCISKKDTVIVVKECIIQPRFTYTKDTTQINRFSFQNTTTSPFPTLKYSWDFGDGSKDTARNPQHVYSQAGSYNVCLQVTETGSCIKSYCENVVVTLPQSRINVSPNPAQNSFNLYLNAEKNSTYVIRISNFSGLVVKEVTYPAVPGANYILINVADLSAGYYVITADNQQEQLQYKFMKL